MAALPLDYEASRPRPPSAGSVGALRRAVVILVVGLIAWAVFSQAWPRPRTPSLHTIAQSRAMQIWAGLRAFDKDHGRVPTQQEGLAALLKPPPLAGLPTGPYLRQLQTDPWGRPFVYYAIPPDSPTPRRSMVLSVGPDGKEGTADDIVFAN